MVRYFWADDKPTEAAVKIDTSKSSGRVNSANENAGENTSEISLITAYKIGLTNAKAWNKDARLVLITSVDDGKKELAGAAGKRSKWNLLFTDSSAEQTMRITITDGIVSDSAKIQEKTKENVLINPENIKVDSTDILEKAKKEFKLKPGVDWANGYHFSLMNNGDSTSIVVTGLTGNDAFTQLYYNSKTGKFIGSNLKPESSESSNKN